MQSQQMAIVENPMLNIMFGNVSDSYKGVANLDSRKVLRLEENFEEFRVSPGALSDDWAVALQTEGGYHSEGYWNKTSKIKSYLVSTVTGERKLLLIV